MVDPITNMPIVILREHEGDRVLPIWVGVFEANAIAIQIENVETPRPMTHDLIRNMLADLDARVEKIVISSLKENTFYASIHLHVGGEEVAVDSRPSDAIAVGLRMKAPIMISEKLFEKAGLSESDLETSKNSDKVLSVKELEDRLQVAVDNEKYEVAAKIRDQINELKE